MMTRIPTNIQWILFVLLEVIIVSYYKVNTPYCEPCIPNKGCPPCISEEQIVSFLLGIMIFLTFIIWQIVTFSKIRRSKRLKN